MDTTTTKSPTPPSQAEDWELQRDAQKVLGDEAFRNQHYNDAVGHYTQALSLDPQHPKLLSNRSAAYLKLNYKSKALQDAKTLVEVDESFAKGHSRMAAALHALSRWASARDAYQHVLSLDPGNAAAKQGLEECLQKLQQQQDSERERQEAAVAADEIDTGNISTSNAASATDEPPQAQNDPLTNFNNEKPEEDDLLDDFFTEVEEATKPKPVDDDIDDQPTPTNAIRNQTTDLGTPEEQIERLLAPNYAWRNLDPFFVLSLSHDATTEDISRRYKALSLLLHPDKCRAVERDQAKEAYDQVQAAKRQLDDEVKRKHVRQLVVQGQRQGKSDWKKARVPEGELEQYQSKAVQRIFAEIEHKRRQVERRERKQEQRERDQEEEELTKERKERQFDKKWRDDTRVEKRIGSWRDFQKKKPASKKQKF